MPSASKDDLLKRKQDLLRKQKRVCEEMNELLTRDETGLNEVSRMTKRSLEVAIVLSKRPGAIDYYEQPEETQTIVRNNDLKNLSSGWTASRGRSTAWTPSSSRSRPWKKPTGGRHGDDQH